MNPLLLGGDGGSEISGSGYKPEPAKGTRGEGANDSFNRGIAFRSVKRAQSAIDARRKCEGVLKVRRARSNEADVVL